MTGNETNFCHCEVAYATEAISVVGHSEIAELVASPSVEGLLTMTRGMDFALGEDLEIGPPQADKPMNSSVLLHSRNFLTCSTLCNCPSFMISSMSQS